MNMNKETTQSSTPDRTENLTARRKKNSHRKSGKRNKGTLLILLGTLLIIGSLSLTSYNLWDNDRAGKASEQILQSLDEQIGAIKPSEPSTIPSTETYTNPSPDSSEDDSATPSDTSTEVSDPEPMHTISIDDSSYIGTIEIPSLGIRLPVMDGWNYQRLKISPCLYSGSYLENNMVICGHNYRTHFSPIKQIRIGADVYFVTVDKIVYHYKVCNRETIPPTSIQEMITNMSNAEDDSGAVENWHLTLFTCNPGGQTRCAVRCIRADS